MKSLNKVMLIGNVGRDVELKTTNGGTSVSNFSIATAESRKNAAGMYEDVTTWHDITAFAKTAEIASKFLQKGSRVYIEGRLSVRSWEKDGLKKTKTEIIADSIILLGAKQMSADTAAFTDEADDIPSFTEPMPAKQTAPRPPLKNYAPGADGGF